MRNLLGLGQRLLVGGADVVEQEERDEQGDERDAEAGDDHDPLRVVLRLRDGLALGRAHRVDLGEREGVLVRLRGRGSIADRGKVLGDLFRGDVGPDRPADRGANTALLCQPE